MSKATPTFYALALASVTIIAGFAAYFGVSASGEHVEPSPYIGVMLIIAGTVTIIGFTLCHYIGKRIDLFIRKIWNRLFGSTLEGKINQMFK